MVDDASSNASRKTPKGKKAGKKHNMKEKEQTNLSNLPIRKRNTYSRNRPISALEHTVVLRPTAVGPTPTTTTTQKSWIIYLEERQDLPIFWDGKESVPLIRCEPFQKGKQPFYASIGEFLSNFVAGKYLESCSMSLQASTTKYISDLRLTDPFSRILDHQEKDGKPVTLMLSHKPGPETTQSGYAKFTLYIREGSNKRVLWDGYTQANTANRITARLGQADMGSTVEQCLQSYVARGYLNKCQVELLKEGSVTGTHVQQETTPVSKTDELNTLFKGNFASVIIRNPDLVQDSGSESGIAVEEAPTQPQQSVDENNGASRSSTTIPVFVTPRPSSHWQRITWGDIKAECNDLLSAVELTMQDYLLTTAVSENLLKMKRSLQTAMRRRNRIPDEVWLCYRALQRAHEDVLNGNYIVEQRRTVQSASALVFNTSPSQSVHRAVGVPIPPPTITIDNVPVTPGRLPMEMRMNHMNNAGTDNGDVPANLLGESSCLEILSSSLIRCGIELEIYDEETNGLHRVAGVGLGIAVVVAICTVVYYF